MGTKEINLKNLFIYKEPVKKNKFELKENIEGKEGKKDKEDKDNKDSSKENKGDTGKKEGNEKETAESTKGITFAKPITTQNKQLKENISSKSNESNKSKKNNKSSNNKSSKENNTGTSEDDTKISKCLMENLEYMKKAYTIPDNGDIVLREFDVIVHGKSINAFIIFFDGMVDRAIINLNILQPLMMLSNLDIKSSEEDVAGFIRKHLLPQNQLKIVNEYVDVIDEVNFGGCGIFIDGIDTAFVADVKGWEHRGVDKPNTEIVLRGPQEGFTEILRVNTALIRKILKDKDLIAENIQIGERSKTACSILYIKDIVNDSLVEEVRRRLKSIKIDYLLDSGQLEQLIEDNTFTLYPQIVETERPDRIASFLSEGKVAVIVNGSPFVLAMPILFTELFKSPEDYYTRFPFANFLKFIRIVGIILSLLLPGIYVAITNYHHEMIPTALLLAIEAAREKVPFPSLIEILIMEFSFELIREAGIRIPGPIGPTLGIIGALILGQAAVAASIVSPILIIIVAVTGIGSFAAPSFSMGIGFRIIRFVYIILGSIAGFLGITTGIYIQLLSLASTESFGVSFIAPFGSKIMDTGKDLIARSPVWKQENRPSYLFPKDKKRQPNYSRGWIKEDKEDGSGRKNQN